MGWKSTLTISRTEAINLLCKCMLMASNEQLEGAVEGIGYGDDPNKEYYGHNFTVVSDDEFVRLNTLGHVSGINEDLERATYERLKEKYEK